MGEIRIGRGKIWTSYRQVNTKFHIHFIASRLVTIFIRAAAIAEEKISSVVGGARVDYEDRKSADSKPITHKSIVLDQTQTIIPIETEITQTSSNCLSKDYTDAFVDALLAKENDEKQGNIFFLNTEFEYTFDYL